MRAKDAGAVPPRSGLRSLKFKCRYKSPADNILDDFLVPVLSASKHYYRVAGFFSSSVLSAAARGVAAFVESGEKMQLIVGGILYEEDVEAISRGHTTEHEVLEKNLGTALENLEDALIRKRLEVLAWLVSVEKLEIRVAIPLAPDGSLIPSNQAYWHEKFAVFEDHSGDRIQIEGSINESETGWRENSEAFSVHKSWIDGQSEYVQDSLSEFVDLFRGHAKHCLVMDLPTAARKALLKYRPSEAPSGEPRRTSTLIETIAQDLGGLWPHQRKAFECWLANGQRGILAMATGSGKTRASMACIRFAAEHRPIVLILVPKLGLMKQWEMEVRRVWPDSSVILCSGETDWRTTLPPRLLVSEGLTFLISTMQTACGRDLKPMVTKLVSPSRLFLVVDEVHHIGAPAYSNVLTWCHPELGRLGLSATPERAWDSIGTERTFSYFDGVVYEYGIGEAIRDGYLSKYQYFPRFVSLSDSELEDYTYLSRRIVKRMATLRGDPTTDVDETDDRKLQLMLFERARIIKSAAAKVPAAVEIVIDEGLSRCLVYCDTEAQLDSLGAALEARGISLAAYTYRVSGRDLALDRFSRGHVDVLLAIKCLDEGVDLPWCRDALILASSSDSAEFIQRRGRILRRHPDKAFARVYDLSVLPFDPELGPGSTQRFGHTEISILKKEMRRIQLFLEDAENSVTEQARILEIRRMITELS